MEKELLASVLRELRSVDAYSAKYGFNECFRRFCGVLELDDDAAAAVFSARKADVVRWRRGTASPPDAMKKIRFMRQELGRLVMAEEGT